MECVSCKRSDASRRFYCAGCVSTRLGDHHSRRHVSRGALELVQAKALSLLTPPAASPVLGVREESELKALKFSLATTLRDLRLAAANAREDMAADRTERDRRRENLDKRRANLVRARTLLDSLTTDAAAPPPDSLTALRSTRAALDATTRDVQLQLQDALMRNSSDLVSAYGLKLATECSDSSSDNPFRSSTSDDGSSASLFLSASEQTYLIADLAIPRLSDLAVVPPVALSTVLSHLLHLVRLVAFYYNLDLPFTPNPSLFDPGRPGVVAAPGWATGAPTTSFPCFVLRSKKQRTGGGTGGGADGPEQSGGREPEGSIRDEQDEEARAKAVVGGAVALAYDFAWIAWRRGDDSVTHLEALDDLGALVLKALGGWPKDRKAPVETLPNFASRSTKFPLDFAAALKTFTAPSASVLIGAIPDDTAEDGWDIV